MTNDHPKPPSVPVRRPPRWTWLVLVLIVAALAGLYVARNLIAREALLRWLREHGAPAEADIRGLGLSGLSGRIVVGPPDRPDFSVETSQIGYRLTLTPNGVGLQVRSLQLVRPVLRATVKGGKLSFGSLDPLIEEFRKRPPTPDARQPQIRIEAGRVLLGGDLGAAEIRADAQLDDGQLLRLDARLAAPARLKVKTLSAELGGGRLVLVKRRDRMDLDLDAQLDRLAKGDLAAEGIHLRLTGQGPYPDLKRRRGDGAANLRLTAQADAVINGAAQLRTAQLDASFAGRTAGWIDTLSVAGSGTGEAQLKILATPAATAQDVKLGLVARTLSWTQRGGSRLALDLRGDGEAARVEAGALVLREVAARAEGPVSLQNAAATASLTGAASARGAITGMAAAKADVAEVAAVKSFLRDFTISAPGLRLALGPGGPAVDLIQPVRLRGLDGGEATLTAKRGVLFRDGAGAFDLTTQGGGLPKVAASVEALRLQSGGAAGRLRLSVASDFDMVRTGRLQASGTWRIADGAMRFSGDRCAPFSAERLEFGDNDVTGVSGELCPAGKPMFEHRGDGWQVRGAVRGGKGASALLQTAVSDAAGSLSFGITREALVAAVELSSAQARDTAPEPRFFPIRIAGPALLREGVWQAAIQGVDQAGRRLGEAQVTHDVRTGMGEANLDTGDLAFAPGSLQPAALSPLAAAIASPAQGHAGFHGTINWSPEGVTSRGVLTIRELDFVSALGPVRGLAGEITLTSLAPLAAAPEQRLRIATIDAFTPITGVEATIGVADEATQVRSVSAAVAGGRVRLENMIVPFARGATWGGVLQVEGVQLGPMVEASPFADRIDIDARVTGRIPFQRVPQGLRIAKGEIRAIQPGRLSIRREALSGVSATTAEPGPAAEPGEAAAQAPNAFSDFAYQAMEHLAFDTLSADIDSLPKGRLGVVFRIKGEHTPPTRQELRVPVGELIDQSFMNKPQPLPSGTKVDLTLDTTLNLDQLLEDFAGYRDAHGSGGVQAQGAKTPSPTVEQSK